MEVVRINLSRMRRFYKRPDPAQVSRMPHTRALSLRFIAMCCLFSLSCICPTACSSRRPPCQSVGDFCKRTCGASELTQSWRGAGGRGAASTGEGISSLRTFTAHL